jgi:cell division protein ZapA
MSQSDDLVEVTILGKKLSLRADGNEDYVREVAQYVEEKMDHAQSSAQTSSLNVAIMAALNIADDYFKILGTQKKAFAQIEQQCIDLVNFIDSKN